MSHNRNWNVIYVHALKAKIFFISFWKKRIWRFLTSLSLLHEEEFRFTHPSIKQQIETVEARTFQTFGTVSHYFTFWTWSTQLENQILCQVFLFVCNSFYGVTQMGWMSFPVSSPLGASGLESSPEKPLFITQLSSPQKPFVVCHHIFCFIYLFVRANIFSSLCNDFGLTLNISIQNRTLVGKGNIRQDEKTAARLSVAFLMYIY